MSEKIFNKLVRGKIPEIMRADGETPVTRILGQEEYRHELLNKLIEEAIELRDSGGSRDEWIDVTETAEEIARVFSFDADDIQKGRLEKRDKRGGFEERIYLEKSIRNEV